jgi:hypothetical protein
VSDVASRIAAASGDAGQLLALAIELANENARLAGHAAALEEAEAMRKEAQAERKRRQRHGTSRDVTGRSVTERDSAGPSSPSSPPSLLSPTPPNNSSPPSPPPRARRAVPARPSGPSWVAEGVNLWASIIGAVPPGEFGKSLKPMVDLHGWPRVRPDLEKWLRERLESGRPARPAWYAGEVTARLAPKPPLVDEHGQLTEYGERMTRPEKVSA